VGCVCWGTVGKVEENEKTYIIIAAVHTELSGQCHRAAEEEDGVEDIESEGDRSAGHHAGECAGDEEEEREH
jgi:hypothetical protein